ncbi:uncharacterized protein LOC113555299 [Rhopalosiphum maidis]|nr:uncharacterized protein LOC113555299 [Rhopalosiphum maidis]
MKYIDLMMSLSTDTGFGLRTIRSTVKEYKETGVVSSPNKKKIRSTVIEKIDDFNKNAIRQKIHSFWFRREIPTLMKVLAVINEDSELPNLSRSGLYRLLADLNFEFTKRNRNSALTERNDLILWRRRFIRDIRRYRNEGRTIYFLDETWVNAGECTNKVWVDNTVKSCHDAFIKGLTTGAKNPTGKGKRLIVLHIGSSNGFVEGGLLCFESKKNSADYHDEMNGDSFFEWFCRVLPLLNENSVIVMDNASYHSVKKDPIPTKSWTKNKIIQWLQDKNVEIDKTWLKIELLDKVQQFQPVNKYVIDEEAKKYNKIVLRLPPYHCELNPIELAWSVVKNHVRQNNSTYKLSDVRQLLIDGVKKVSPEMWANFVKHTIAEENKMWDIDCISEEMLEENPSTTHVLTITGETTSDSD